MVRTTECKISRNLATALALSAENEPLGGQQAVGL